MYKLSLIFVLNALNNKESVKIEKKMHGKNINTKSSKICWQMVSSYSKAVQVYYICFQIRLFVEI